MTTYLITFEPGDGYAYKVLYGAPASRFPFTVFGLAEDGDALITVPLNAEATEDAFMRRWQTAEHTRTINPPRQLAAQAFLLYLWLLAPHRRGEADPWAEDVTERWAEDWEARLAAARRRAGDLA
ncbi:MAG TPA: hypothetical protein PKD53_00515 [Chloroflexaceae bacterium]|nr:hypothetical protein [Chloroflexaceae bacterium]